MSSYCGDIALGSTLYFHFTTRQISGAPATLASSPVLSAYPADSLTQLTAGITLSVDHDSVTGLNSVKIIASSGNGYATATDYSIVITTGTVNSVSVVGEVIGSFSIENRSALRPTTAARTLDVSAGGEAGVDWANVGSPTTTLDLSGTTINALQKVDVNTIKTQAVTCAAGVTILASVGTAATSTAQTGDNFARLGAPAGASVSADIAAAKVDTAAIKVVTDKFAFTVANQVDCNVITKTGFRLSATGVADILTSALTESYAADGAAPTLAQFQFMMWSLLAERNISSTTLTTLKLDGATTSMTFTLDSATTPAAQTRTT